MGAELWEAVCWRRGSIRHLFLKKSQNTDSTDEPVAEGAEPEPEQQQQQQQKDQQDQGGEDRESVLVAEAVGSLQLMLRAQVHTNPHSNPPNRLMSLALPAQARLVCSLLAHDRVVNAVSGAAGERRRGPEDLARRHDRR